MKDIKFNKIPLSPLEKEKKAEEFLEFKDFYNVDHNKNIKEKKIEKVEMKAFPFRIPSNLFQDLKEINELTGISINSICLELLRPSIKRKLKEIKDIE